MALPVERDGLGQLLDEEWPLWSGPDEAHVAAQHVPELRYFVEARQTDDAADARDPVVLVAGPDGRAARSASVRIERNL